MKYRKRVGAPASSERYIAEATEYWTPADYQHYGLRALLLAVLNRRCGSRKSKVE